MAGTIIADRIQADAGSNAVTILSNTGTTVATFGGDGQLRFIAGSASVPAIAPSGDLNTGIFFPAADTIAFTEGGVEAMRIDSGGNLLLNTTTNNNSAKMKIATAARTGTFFDLNAPGGESWIVDSNNTTGSTDVLGIYALGATGWYLQDNGNVGIGTTSPSTFGQLAVYGNGTAPVIANFLGSNSPATNATYGDIAFGSRTDGTVTARIRGFANDNGNGTDGQLSFWTADNTAGAGALTERARITSDGQLLVGTTTSGATPSQGFVFTPSTDSLMRIGHANGTGSGSNYVLFGYNSTNIGAIYQSGTTAVVYNTTSDYRLKNISGNLTGYKERIMALQPKQGTWKSDGAEFRGFLAHEFANQYPSLVSGEKDGVDSDGNPQYQGMQAGGSETIADLVAMIQEQQAMIDELKAEVAALKSA